MSSRRPPRSPRKSSSPELTARLERTHERVLARRVLARQRERVIAAAVRRYLQDWQEISGCENARDRDLAGLREQISAVQNRAAEQIARLRADQAAAAALIRDQGQSDDDVAELLELTVKQARQLIGAARTHSNSTIPESDDHPEVSRTRPETTGANSDAAITDSASSPGGVGLPE